MSCIALDFTRAFIYIRYARAAYNKGVALLACGVRGEQRKNSNVIGSDVAGSCLPGVAEEARGARVKGHAVPQQATYQMTGSPLGKERERGVWTERRL